MISPMWFLIAIAVVLVLLLLNAWRIGRKDTGSVRSGSVRRNALDNMRDLQTRVGPNLVRRRDGSSE